MLVERANEQDAEVAERIKIELKGIAAAIELIRPHFGTLTLCLYSGID
jgi:hypothetical protein